MSLEQSMDTFVEDMLRGEEARQFDQRLTPVDKEQMKSMGRARVAADDVETLTAMARSEQAGVKTEEWKPGRPVRIWNIG